MESRPGEGSTFHFTVDLEPREREEEENPRDGKLEKLRILVVDDNAAAREIYREMILSFGFSVGTASSAEEARDVLGDRAGDNWDIVLLDGDMPGKSGRELTDERITEPAPSPKIILMTASESDEELNASVKNPLIAKVLAKPLMPSSLLNAIHDSMGIAEIRPLRTDSLDREIKQIKARLNGCHVLLVEDNEINQEVALEILSRAGITSDLAENGQDAVDMVYAEDYDAVLMDCQLPLMDGYEATGKIRELERFAELPIIAMTANVLSGDRERSLSSGMNDHVGKPVNPKEIYRVLDKWIGRNRDVSLTEQTEPAALSPLKKPPRIYGLDYREGMTLLGGNGELYFRLLGKFIDTYAAFADDFQRAENDQDRDAAARLAHSLKGSAGNIAARLIAEKAGDLESAVRRKDESARTEALESLTALLDPFILALQEYRESGSEERKSPMDNGPSRLTEEMVIKMKGLLGDSDTEAVDYLGEFVSAAEDDLQLTPAFKSFVKSVERYEFEEALDQLEKIKEGTL